MLVIPANDQFIVSFLKDRPASDLLANFVRAIGIDGMHQIFI